jgi:hypothetical protein
MGRRRGANKLLATGLAAAVASALYACEFIYDIPVETEAGANDASVDRAASDARTQGDAGTTGEDRAVVDVATKDSTEETVYNLIKSSSNWSDFNAATLSPKAIGFTGGSFDGRYVYLCPNEGTLAVRYDTQNPDFAGSAAWSTFDTAPFFALDAGPPPKDAAPPPDAGLSNVINGCVFDGTYLYFIPGSGESASQQGFAVRYNTTQPFTAAGSWESFETPGVDGGGAYGFAGGTFDGRYVYMVPDELMTFGRYDTKSPFTAAGFSTVDVSTLDAGADLFGFVGGVFDGRYVYAIPGFYASTVLRYDTQASWTSPSSWTSFDTATVNSTVMGSAGGAFDGQYVYIAPAGSGVVLRYQVSQPFGMQPSWGFFDMTMLKKTASGYFGAAFDGRFVYFVPDYHGDSSGEGTEDSFTEDTGDEGEPTNLVVRYDTTANFYDTTSWQLYDTQPLDNAMGFSGAIFDGEYMYFVPYANQEYDGVVARFNAKTPPKMPALPDFFGSFY